MIKRDDHVRALSTDPSARHQYSTCPHLRLEKQALIILLSMMHNHPSGDPTPSRADIEITKQVVQAGRALNVEVHDHLVVGRDGVASFKQLGLM